MFSFSRKEKDSTEKAFYKLMNDQDLVDVTLVCDDGKIIKAHKVILGAGSEFFKRMFSSNPHQNPLVYLYGIDRVNLESALEFLYLGETSVLECNLQNFLDISEKLRIAGITRQQKDKKLKTPDLVKINKMDVPDKEMVEDTTPRTAGKHLKKSRGERSHLPKLDNDQKIMRTSVNNLEKIEQTTAPVNNYSTGYYTTSPAPNTRDQISQKELRKSFDRYEVEKLMRPDSVKQHVELKSDRPHCDICGYRALSKEDLRLHRMGFHCIY